MTRLQSCTPAPDRPEGNAPNASLDTAARRLIFRRPSKYRGSMTRIQRAALGVALTLITMIPDALNGQNAANAANPASAKASAAAMAFINALDAGDFAKAANMGAPSVVAYFSADKL